MNDSIYTSITQTKNDSFIPVLANGKTIESKYNPEHQAETIIQQIEKPYTFFIVAGIGSGILLKLLSLKFPEAKIIAIEYSNHDLVFLEQFETFKECKNNPNIILTSFDNLQITILQNYIPALYGDLKVIFQPVWAQENPDYFSNIKECIQSAMIEISRDYSTQCHFGKIWQKNIINNIYACSTLKTEYTFTPDLNKTAAVIAAGPSLDSTIQELIINRNNYFIISTDTAHQTLLKNKVYSDAVVSIDGQSVSYNHFFNSKCTDTSYIFDLCANPAVTKKLLKDNAKLFFFNNGHPLSQSASEIAESRLPQIYTGSGTVTIAALDIALKAGFKKIEVFGADFGYINNKPYTKGTYLDSLYNKQSNFKSTAEYNFSKLMFRTELLKISPYKKTSEILQSYEKSLEEYLLHQELQFTRTDYKYIISSNMKTDLCIKNIKIDYQKYVEYLSDVNYVPFLPYIAYLRNQNKYKDCTFADLLKLAHDDIVRYN